MEVPAQFLAGMSGGSKVEYFMVAVDAADGELSLLGSAKEPFGFAIEIDAVEAARALAAAQLLLPPRKKWPIIVGAVAGVVGGALVVGLGVGLTRSRTTVLPAEPWPQ